jgi:hypothetical protein
MLAALAWECVRRRGRATGKRGACAGGRLGRVARSARASPRRGRGHSRSTPAPVPPRITVSRSPQRAHLIRFALTAIFSPFLGRHAGIMGNLRDGCQVLVSPAVAALCDRRGGRGGKVCFACCKTRGPRSARPLDDEAGRRIPVRDARDALQRHRSHRAPFCGRLPLRGAPTPPTRRLRPLSAS